MKRFGQIIESWHEMKESLENDGRYEVCPTATIPAELKRFQSMYLAYFSAARSHVGKYYAGDEGWTGNLKGSFNAVLGTPVSYVTGFINSGSRAVAGQAAKDFRRDRLQRGCEYTAVAMQKALARSDRPSGWHVMICRIGKGVNHVAAAACYASKEGNKQYEYDELGPYLKTTGYVFDPWLRGKPDVYTMQQWLDKVNLAGVQLHWNGNVIWEEGNIRVETHKRPVYH